MRTRARSPGLQSQLHAAWLGGPGQVGLLLIWASLFSARGGLGGNYTAMAALTLIDVKLLT